jgi:hypothetical protein
MARIMVWKNKLCLFVYLDGNGVGAWVKVYIST